MLSASNSTYFKPIHNIAKDFPFLFKVIEFRILLVGLGKEERERYTHLWFAREEALAAMSPDQLEFERKKYIGRLLRRGLNLTVESREELSELYISSLYSNLNTLTRGKLSGVHLKKKKNELLSELMAWVSTIEDATIIAFVEPYLKEMYFQEAVQYFWGFEIKALILFSSLDTKNSLYQSTINKSNGAWLKLLISPFIDNSSKHPPWPIKLTQRLQGILSKMALVLLVAECIDFLGKVPSAPYGLMLLGVIALNGSFNYLLAGALAFYYNKKSSLKAAEPVTELSESFAPLIDSFFQKVVKDLFSKEREPGYQPRPGDLSFLRAFYVPAGVASEQKEMEIALPGEKIKTHSRPFLQLKALNAATNFFVPEEKKKSDNKISLGENIIYLLTENNRYIKLDKQMLDRLFKSHYSKQSSSQFIQEVFSTVERTPRVDKIGEDETRGRKGLYPGCSHKLRLNLNNSLFRVGLAARPPTKVEEEQGVLTEVYSPRVLTRGHKKGHTIR